MRLIPDPPTAACEALLGGGFQSRRVGPTPDGTVTVGCRSASGATPEPPAEQKQGPGDEKGTSPDAASSATFVLSLVPVVCVTWRWNPTLPLAEAGGIPLRPPWSPSPILAVAPQGPGRVPSV